MGAVFNWSFWCITVLCRLVWPGCASWRVVFLGLHSIWAQLLFCLFPHCCPSLIHGDYYLATMTLLGFFCRLIVLYCNWLQFFSFVHVNPLFIVVSFLKKICWAQKKCLWPCCRSVWAKRQVSKGAICPQTYRQTKQDNSSAPPKQILDKALPPWVMWPAPFNSFYRPKARQGNSCNFNRL